MTNLGRVAELTAHRDAVARAWWRVMEAQDRNILAKIQSYLRDGSFEAEMPTQLIWAQKALLEALDEK